MNTGWRADLRLKLEDLVDKFVVEGIGHAEIMKALNDEIENLQKAYERDPDPADDDTVIDEPANDWPGAS
jgi:hypothetical protein